MSAEKRETFMARVRSALGRREALARTPPPPEIDESIVRLAAEGAGGPALFETQARASGMIVHRVTGSGLTERLRSLLVEMEVRRVTTNLDGPWSDHVAIAVKSAGTSIVDWRSAPGLEAHYDVDAGITTVEAALAETGTIIVSSGPGCSRGTFLVPPIHIAVLGAGDILADMIDYWKRPPAHGRRRPAATVFITGPSKTADIEGVLVTGVHGPREVHVLVVGDS